MGAFTDLLLELVLKVANVAALVLAMPVKLLALAALGGHPAHT